MKRRTLYMDLMPDFEVEPTEPTILVVHIYFIIPAYVLVHISRVCLFVVVLEQAIRAPGGLWDFL